MIQMDESQCRGLVKIVGYFFVISSIFNLLAGVVLSYYFDGLILNFCDLLNIVAGLGLLCLRRGWRKYSLFYLWYVVLLIGVVLIAFPHVNFQPSSLNDHKPVIRWVIVFFGSLYTVCLVILLLPPVRNLFLSSGEPEGGCSARVRVE